MNGVKMAYEKQKLCQQGKIHQRKYILQAAIVWLKANCEQKHSLDLFGNLLLWRIRILGLRTPLKCVKKGWDLLHDCMLKRALRLTKLAHLSHKMICYHNWTTIGQKIPVNQATRDPWFCSKEWNIRMTKYSGILPPARQQYNNCCCFSGNSIPWLLWTSELTFICLWPLFPSHFRWLMLPRRMAQQNQPANPDLKLLPNKYCMIINSSAWFFWHR
jgi:hypothetical protein